jgi:type II secretion system (T2SS) protein N
MPASPSPNRAVNLTPRPRSYWPLVLIGLAAVVAVVIATLPASVITHFLPPIVHAEDFSGSIWHGSAGKLTVAAHDAGALEWRLEPRSLLGLAVTAQLHWVKVGFVVDAAVKLDRHALSAHNLKGGGPIEDLRDLGVAAGWRGIADIDFSQLEWDFTKPLLVAGNIHVSNITAAQVAGGADLGSYDLRFGPNAVDAEGNVAATLEDTGGPLRVQAVIQYSAKQRTALLTGTVQERPDIPAPLRSQIDGLAQLRARDAQGRLPIDLEFRL